MENSNRSPLKIFSDIFASVTPVLAASGLMLALLKAVQFMLGYFNIMDLTTHSTFQLIYLAFSLIFTLFPVFIAWSAARALKCNEAVAMIIGSLMVAPDLLAYMAGSGERITFLGIPVMRQTWMLGNASEWYSYSGTVIPALLAVLVLYLLERLLYVLFNEEVGAVAVPLLSLLVMIPLTLCIIGPVGLFAGKGALFLYQKAEAVSPIAGGAMIGGLWSLLLSVSTCALRGPCWQPSSRARPAAPLWVMEEFWAIRPSTTALYPFSSHILWTPSVSSPFTRGDWPLPSSAPGC